MPVKFADNLRLLDSNQLLKGVNLVGLPMPQAAASSNSTILFTRRLTSL